MEAIAILRPEAGERVVLENSIEGWRHREEPPVVEEYGGFLAKAAQSREQIEEECPILLLLPFDFLNH